MGIVIVTRNLRKMANRDVWQLPAEDLENEVPNKIKDMITYIIII